STRLESKGIEPGVYRTVLLAPGSVPGRSASSSAPATAPPQQQALSAIAALLATLLGGAAAAPTRGRGGGSATASSPLLDLDLDIGDATAGSAAIERPVVELLTRLFDT